MENIEQLKNAFKIFDIEDSISIIDLKKRYRVLALKYHPDRCGDDDKKCKEKMAELNLAYELLISFVENYQIPVDYEELKDKLKDPMSRFRDDWMWGPAE